MLARTIRGPWASSQAWFRTDADCLDYLEWLRWPAGFVCAECGHDRGWRLGDGRYRCSGCGGRTSVTAGTVFDRSSPRRSRSGSPPVGCSRPAKTGSRHCLQRTLEIGSYQTAGPLLGCGRCWCARAGTGCSRRGGGGATYIGGEEPGLAGGRARGKKVLTGIAVEIQDRRKASAGPDAAAGRCVGRLAAPLRDRSRCAARDGDHRWLAGLQRAREARLCPDRRSSGRPEPAARIPARSCRRCIGWSRWPSAGCWAPTRARWSGVGQLPE